MSVCVSYVWVLLACRCSVIVPLRVCVFILLLCSPCLRFVDDTLIALRVVCLFVYVRVMVVLLLFLVFVFFVLVLLNAFVCVRFVCVVCVCLFLLFGCYWLVLVLFLSHYMWFSFFCVCDLLLIL